MTPSVTAYLRAALKFCNGTRDTFGEVYSEVCNTQSSASGDVPIRRAAFFCLVMSRVGRGLASG
jgi:hypothetical protein